MDNIKVYGYVNTKITLGNYEATSCIIVCEMKQPGILGQDFLKVNIKTWNFDNLELCTKNGLIVKWFLEKRTKQTRYVGS